MQLYHRIFSLSLITIACASTSFAAKPIDLSHQTVNILQSLDSPNFKKSKQPTIKKLSTHIDSNNMAHIRVQQTYAGYSVWGADAILHVPHANANTSLTKLNSNTKMNGIVFQELTKDLINTPEFIFTESQSKKALLQAMKFYQEKTGIKKFDLDQTQKQLIVYIDKNNKAHWAYLISFLSAESDNMPALPTYILDAVSFEIYEQWNNLQTLEKAGGLGGNLKTKAITYDGSGSNPDLNILHIDRDASKNLCYLKNDQVTVKDDNHRTLPGPWGDAPAAQFACATTDPNHNNLYWDGDQDAVNGGFSPANDALHIGQIIKQMYQKWYNTEVLTVFGTKIPLMLNMHVHARDMSDQPMDNAYFFSFNNSMYFGDGVSMFYPLTSIGVGAHEVSHGFTSQHSNLTYQKQSGGLNESFSDMAAQTAEYFAIGENTWQIGPEIFKGDGALRYMDDPTKDGRSIGNIKDYKDSINVHYTSGIYNKVFHRLSTAKNWDPKKAFAVMIKANMDYWTANTDFVNAGCGAIKAAKDLSYDTETVTWALSEVGITQSMLNSCL